MTRSISPQEILDAAESIVSESGALHMTLDAVAERAQASKGGLMYRFPNKDALLQAMIGRLISDFEAKREEIRSTLSEENANPLLVEIKAMKSMEESEPNRTAAILAVLANQPKLMEPFQESIRQRFSEEIFSHANPQRSTVIFLAALGLHLSSMLNFPVLEDTRRQEVYTDLIRLAQDESTI